jgi:hypothetical protein
MAATAYIFDSALEDFLKGQIIIGTDTFKMMLLTSTAAPSKSGWAKRSDVTNEVAGTGYTAAGQAVTVTTTAAAGASDKESINLADVSWAASTITARYAVVYKSRGGASTADNLLALIDFGADFTDTNGTFTVHMSTQLSIQN